MDRDDSGFHHSGMGDGFHSHGNTFSTMHHDTNMFNHHGHHHGFSTMILVHNRYRQAIARLGTKSATIKLFIMGLMMLSFLIFVVTISVQYAWLLEHTFGLIAIFGLFAFGTLTCSAISLRMYINNKHNNTGNQVASHPDGLSANNQIPREGAVTEVNHGATGQYDQGQGGLGPRIGNVMHPTQQLQGASDNVNVPTQQVSNCDWLAPVKSTASTAGVVHSPTSSRIPPMHQNEHAFPPMQINNTLQQPSQPSAPPEATPMIHDGASYPDLPPPPYPGSTYN